MLCLKAVTYMLEVRVVWGSLRLETLLQEDAKGKRSIAKLQVGAGNTATKDSLHFAGIDIRTERLSQRCSQNTTDL